MSSYHSFNTPRRRASSVMSQEYIPAGGPMMGGPMIDPIMPGMVPVQPVMGGLPGLPGGVPMDVYPDGRGASYVSGSGYGYPARSRTYSQPSRYYEEDGYSYYGDGDRSLRGGSYYPRSEYTSDYYDRYHDRDRDDRSYYDGDGRSSYYGSSRHHSHYGDDDYYRSRGRYEGDRYRGDGIQRGLSRDYHGEYDSSGRRIRTYGNANTYGHSRSGRGENVMIRQTKKGDVQILRNGREQMGDKMRRWVGMDPKGFNIVKLKPGERVAHTGSSHHSRSYDDYGRYGEYRY